MLLTWDFFIAPVKPMKKTGALCRVCSKTSVPFLEILMCDDFHDSFVTGIR